jgi:signal transduction histidine kinase
MRQEQPPRWITGVSTFVIVALLLSWAPLRLAGTAQTVFAVCSVLALVGAVLLWSHGVREAGSGWRRLVFLAAFAGSIASVADYIRGFLDGLTETPLRSSGPPIGAQDPLRAFPLSDLLVWVVATVVLGIVFHRFERHRSEAAAQAAAAREAREQELRARLAPHFIFNTLNTLHAQIERDPREAQATTEKLAALFRRVIDVSQRPVLPLSEELEFVESYLGIEQARLGDRLAVRIEVPEELEAVEIPPLSLQVLVENAVTHGIAPLERGGTVVVGADRVEGDTIRLWVQDPGPGVSARRGSGTALDVLRQRLGSPDDLKMERAAGVHTVSFVWQHRPVTGQAHARA